MDILRNFHPLSVKGRLLLVKMLVYYGDLAASNGYSKEDNGSFYQQAETILREEVRYISQTHISTIEERRKRRLV